MSGAHEPTAAVTLAAGLEEIGVSLDRSTLDALLDYLEVLQIWNRTYNLTAVHNPVDMVRHHLLDSLTVLPFVRGSRLLDVGTGAGFPGLVIALTAPELRCVLLDKNVKKTRFCLQVIAELGIRNVDVVHVRIEDYQPSSLFSTVVARAFGPLWKLSSLTRHLLQPRGRLIAMKGANPTPELEVLPASDQPPLVIPLKVPGLITLRHLVLLDAGSPPRVDSA